MALRGVVSGGRVDTGITVGMVYAVCGGGGGVVVGVGVFFIVFGRAVTAATVVAAGVCVGRGVGTGYRTWGRERGGRVKRHETGSDYSIPCKAY